MSDSTRPETGPMQFGDDWTGVFLRGDSAGPLAMYLSQFIDQVKRGQKPDPLTTMYAESVVRLLGGADERGERHGLQRCRPWAECAKPT